MRVIAKRPLVQFWTKHPEAERPLRSWLTLCRSKNFENFAQLKQTVRTVENVPRAYLLDCVGVLVSQYEDENTPGLQPAEPVDVRRCLMEQHDLKQSDLRKEIGTQGVASEILSGSRTINARQAKALAKRFG